MISHYLAKRVSSARCIFVFRHFMESPAKKICLVVFLLLVVTSAKVLATHLRAADVRVERVCGTLTYKITVFVYLNSASSTQFGTNSEIFFGDGSSFKIPRTLSTPRPDLGTNISVASFTTDHSYATSGVFTITYIEHDRSLGILNIANSDDVAYATSVTINTDQKFGCNRFPVLNVIPLDRACAGVAFYHSPGASDPEGDSISYELTTPASGINSFAEYISPDDKKFYTDYDKGNETHDGRPAISIDSTGTVTWNAPGSIGEYTIAFKIIEWRKNSVTGKFEKISTTVRDMQIIVEECDNVRPALQIPENVCVIAGEVVTGIVQGTDFEKHPVKIEIFSEVLDFDEANSPATYSPDTSVFVPSDPPAKLYFKWNTSCLHIRQQPYRIVFKITDNPPKGPKLVTFQTWTIKVVAPAPVFSEVELDVIRNYGVLSWKPYPCEAQKIQVWRKVGSFTARPGNCTSGIQKNAGYTLITETNGTTISFVDSNNEKGLAPGATYCYRLVAIVGDAKSIVSEEFCIGPVIRDAPVITNVSVSDTDPKGKIRINWGKAADLKPEQFPPPYKYELYRAEGFIGESGIVNIGITSDTTFLDTLVNTAEHVYNYRVVLYSQPKFSETFIAVDTSALASSVWLTASAESKKISLHWQDSVPWTNVSEERPYHLIYRGTNFDKDESLVLIDSVQVIDNGFYYTDQGQYNNQPLNDNTIYSYRIVTQGTYGNPEFSIQKNASQTVFIYPENNLRPCAPLVTVEITDCATFVNSQTCNQTSFTNVIHWEPDTYDTCRIDIASYKIYAADSPEADFVFLATVDTSGFAETNLVTPARCYRISAIDRKGQEGQLSEPQCNDACPYFELPNVFTPNEDESNDRFTSSHPLTTSGKFETLNPAGCPRFVKSVKLKVYNRWGKPVYNYFSDAQNGFSINWDGTDDHGREMPSGIYYYVCELEFNVLSKDRQKMTLKDWVHLIR
jgi:hypothetical protein